MYVFGFDIPILELLVILCIVIVGYLILLEIEFRQLRKITRRFDSEEVELAKEVKLLKEEIIELRNVFHKKSGK